MLVDDTKEIDIYRANKIGDLVGGISRQFFHSNQSIGFESEEPSAMVSKY